MRILFKYLNKEAAFNSKPWIVVVVTSLLVCFLLAFFQPFGIDKFYWEIRLFVVIGFTLVTAIVTSTVGYLFPFLFKHFYNPQTWTIGKSLFNNILILLLIALGNAIFNWSIGHHLTTTFGSVLLSYLFVTFLIGIIPALFSTFLIQNYYLKKNLKDAITINKQLSERMHQENIVSYRESNVIDITGGTKDKISLCPKNILYIESVGNYVKVNYLDDIVKQKQIRTTLARMEKELIEYSYLVRCHRAYMVNTLHITNVRGNSQGLQLSLQYLQGEVPVSRSYINIINEKL